MALWLYLLIYVYHALLLVSGGQITSDGLVRKNESMPIWVSESPLAPIVLVQHAAEAAGNQLWTMQALLQPLKWRGIANDFESYRYVVAWTDAWLIAPWLAMSSLLDVMRSGMLCTMDPPQSYRPDACCSFPLPEIPLWLSKNESCLLNNCIQTAQCT